MQWSWNSEFFGKTQNRYCLKLMQFRRSPNPFLRWQCINLTVYLQNKNFSAGKLIFCSIYMRSKIFTLSTSAHESWNKSIKFVQFKIAKAANKRDKIAGNEGSLHPPMFTFRDRKEFRNEASAGKSRNESSEGVGDAGADTDPINLH